MSHVKTAWEEEYHENQLTWVRNGQNVIDSLGNNDSFNVEKIKLSLVCLFRFN